MRRLGEASGPVLLDYTVVRSPQMETIQVVLDAKLRKAADLAAKRQKMNRSALIRHALQEHLARLRALELEERDRCGYMAQPQRDREFRVWEEAAAWPEQ
jgi:metal-responsive CopG/Arc/MetJ family transcriptional regulator